MAVMVNEQTDGRTDNTCKQHSTPPVSQGMQVSSWLIWSILMTTVSLYGTIFRQGEARGYHYHIP